MKLICTIQIEGFRSLRKCRLDELDSFTAFAGVNNSGKSNVLRALNAFFNGETDPGVQMDVDRDYFRPELRKKRKAKRISIGVTFSLPEQFRIPKSLSAVRDFLGENSFCIRKEWSRGETLPAYYLKGERPLEIQDRQKVDQFLQLINFRYIPNRVLPMDLIRREHQAIRDALRMKLRGKGKGTDIPFKEIQGAAARLIRAFASRLTQTCPEAGEVRLATPAAWEDLVFTLGYRLMQDGVEFEDTAQGSGVQSLLMLETLHLIDTNYSKWFGWRQASVWAVEEPESSLHSSLEAQVASYLATVGKDPSSRLQILCTTHSDLMLQHSDRVILAQRRKGVTTLHPASDSRDAIDRCSRAGISRWTHPILFYPLDPVVIVEGKQDHAFLSQALLLLRPKPKREVRVTFLELLSPTKTGGKGDLLRYVKENALAIKTRSRTAPVVVVLDWEASNKRGEFLKPFVARDPFKPLVWPAETFNPRLGTSFRGIERHYSNRLIDEAIKRGAPIAEKRSGEMVVSSRELEKVKQVLHTIVQEGLQPEDISHAEPFLREMVKVATEFDELLV